MAAIAYVRGSAVLGIVAFLSRRPAAAFGRLLLVDGWPRADTVGHEIGVLAQPVARALDLDDDGVVEQPVE